jgi:hypothetical protein
MNTMNTGCEVIVFRVHREADGSYSATSPQFSHRDLDRIVEDMPNIIQLWFRRHKNVAVEVLTGRASTIDDTTSYLVGTVPAEIAAKALASAGLCH